MAFVNEILNQVVGRVLVRTEWGPDLVIDEPFSSKPTGATPATAFLRPEISIYPRAEGGLSADPIKFSPYGSPGETKWPFVVVGLGLVLGIMTYRILRR